MAAVWFFPHTLPRTSSATPIEWSHSLHVSGLSHVLGWTKLDYIDKCLKLSQVTK